MAHSTPTPVVVLCIILQRRVGGKVEGAQLAGENHFRKSENGFTHVGIARLLKGIGRRRVGEDAATSTQARVRVYELAFASGVAAADTAQQHA